MDAILPSYKKFFGSLQLFFCVCIQDLIPESAAAQVEDDVQYLLEDRWIELQTPHFRLITDEPPNAAESLSERLEETHFILSFLMNLERNAQLPRVTAIASRRDKARRLLILGRRIEDVEIPLAQEVEALTERQNPSLLDNYFGVLPGKHFFPVPPMNRRWLGYFPTRQNEITYRALQHEYLHVLLKLFEGGTRYPLWYEEGLAEFMSTARLDTDELVYGLSPFYSARELGGYALQDLLVLNTLPDDPTERYRFYRKSWRLINFFYGQPDYNDKVEEYLKYSMSGAPVSTAFQQAFGMTISSFEQVLYSRPYNELHSATLALKQKPEFGEPHVTELSSGDAALELAEFQLNRKGRYLPITEHLREQGRTLLEYAVDSEQPVTSALARYLRLRLVETGPTKEIIREVEELYSDNPRHGGALLAYGYSLMLQADQLADGDLGLRKELVFDSRRKLRAAIYYTDHDVDSYRALESLYSRFSGMLMNSAKELDEYANVCAELHYVTGDLRFIQEAVKRYREAGYADKAVKLAGRYRDVPGSQ